MGDPRKDADEVAECLDVLADHGLKAVPMGGERRRARITLPGGTRADDPDEFSVTAAADFCNCSRDVLLRAIHRQELPAISLAGPGGKPAYLLTHEGLAAFLKHRHWRPEKVVMLEAYLARKAARTSPPAD